ncbi:UNVERIFIED_CONTAM: hypothetical protein FKN15_020691 [Acipenser sinensis]
MATKRKHVVLTIQQELEILSRLEKGETREMIAADFGIGESTVTDIKKVEPNLKSCVGSKESFSACKQRKIMQGAQDDQLDMAIFIRFVQRTNEGMPISGPILTDKAKQLNTMLQRHRIRQLCIQGFVTVLRQQSGVYLLRDVDCLPSLQRLFLSCNSITNFEDIACLSGSPSLTEVSLDENPIAQESWYKKTALRYMVHLRQLDMKRITDEERRMASVVARKEEEKKKEGHKQAIQKEKRRLAIQNAASQWETLIQKRSSTGRSCLELPAQNGSKEQVSPVNGTPNELFTEEPRSSEGAGGPSMQCLSVSDSHLAELDGETLRLFGLGSLEALERGWGVQTAGAVTAIAFRYIDYDAIVPTLPRIRVKFPNVTHLIFSETNVHRLPQLAALAQVRRLDQLTVHPEGNPVVSLALWRSFAIFRLSHFNLQRINGEEVTMNDVIVAERLFGTLAHIAAAETPHYRLLLLLGESRPTMQPPQSYSVGGQRSSGQLTGKPAGARPDQRGHWCAVSRGHPGRPKPSPDRRCSAN